MNKNMNENALKERLKSIATEKNSTINKVWKQLLLERFLARLSHSKYHEKFIFKGGLLLAQYIEIRRETVDIDFSINKMHGEMQVIEDAVKEIIMVHIEDGFYFTWGRSEELNQPHMEYGGFRISLNANFGKMRDSIQVDIGIGDIAESIKLTFNLFEYKGKPIFSGEISLHVYTPEAIFAEKLEAIISKGIINSRMKDYHDIILMIREPNFLNVDKLRDAIQVTFNRRNTSTILPIAFDEKAIKTFQGYWQGHLRGLGHFRSQLNLPEEIKDLINEVNNWITTQLKDISNNPE
jgi:predicted nucleotidyltransferase component of viral defense system